MVCLHPDYGDEACIDHIIKSDRDDPDCVADAVAAFAKTSTQNVLICWEHDALTDIVESLGVDKDDAPEYPDDS